MTYMAFYIIMTLQARGGKLVMNTHTEKPITAPIATAARLRAPVEAGKRSLAWAILGASFKTM